MSRYTLSLMRWRLRLWFVLIGTGSLIAFPPAIHAQCPRGAGGKVVIQRAQTTLPDEMRDGQNETGEEAPHPKVRVEDVTIEGAPDLQESIRAQIDARLPDNDFESGSDWIRFLEENAKEVLQDNGYFMAKVSGQARVLSSDSAEEQVAVCLQVAQGQQYRSGEIQFTGAHVFPPWELRNRVPLYDGDVFDLSKIRTGIEAWKHLYDSQGYINFVASPDVKIDDDPFSSSLWPSNWKKARSSEWGASRAWALTGRFQIAL